MAEIVDIAKAIVLLGAGADVGMVMFARYNTGSSTWPARPTTSTNVTMLWIGPTSAPTPPGAQDYDLRARVDPVA